MWRLANSEDAGNICAVSQFAAQILPRVIIIIVHISTRMDIFSFGGSSTEMWRNSHRQNSITTAGDSVVSVLIQC